MSTGKDIGYRPVMLLLVSRIGLGLVLVSCLCKWPILGSEISFRLCSEKCMLNLSDIKTSRCFNRPLNEIQESTVLYIIKLRRSFLKSTCPKAQNSVECGTRTVRYFHYALTLTFN